MAAPTKSREKTRVQALSQLRGVAEEVYVWQNWLWSFKRMVKPNFSMQVFIFDFHKCILLNEHYMQKYKGTFFSEGGDMFVISTHRWTFFCSSISDLKSPTFLCKRNNVKKCQKSFQISKYQLEIVFSFLIGKPFKSWYIFSQWYNKDADF